MANRPSHPPHISRSPISTSSQALFRDRGGSDYDLHEVPVDFSPQGRYQHFSALRTTGGRQSDTAVETILLSLRNLEEKASLYPSVAMSSACEECVQECEQGTCELELTEQCTEQCVVVPCNDAHHGLAPCEAANAIAGCDIMCTDGPECAAIDTIVSILSNYPLLAILNPRRCNAVQITTNCSWTRGRTSL